MEVKKEHLEWLSSEDTGISSKTMFSAITGIPVGCCDIPYDIADVGRCVRMLRILPDLRSQLSKVIELHKEWMPFIDCWKALERYYDEVVAYEALSEEEKKKMKKRKHFVTPNENAWNTIQELVCASRYIRGWRLQNSTTSWRTTPPENF